MLQKENKEKMKKTTKNILVGGFGLMLGSIAMGKIAGTSTNPNVANIASSGQSALNVGSAALPIYGAKSVIDSLDMLTEKKVKKK